MARWSPIVVAVDRIDPARIVAATVVGVRLVSALSVVLVTWTIVAPPASAAGEHRGVSYQRPVPGELVRSFEPPRTRWGPGHRGVDLAARSGGAVRAAADGAVAFAGSVARQRWVTVSHADGVRTSYGPLREVAVRAGQRVRAGQALGSVAGGHHPSRTVLHWSARRGSAYIDPMSLLGAGRWRPALVGPGGTEVVDLPDLRSYAPWTGRRGLGGAIGLVEGSPVAEHAGWSLAPNPNHVIGVAGLSSFTGRVPLDLTHLGYAPADTTYLSYAGRLGQHGPPDPDDPYRDQRPYGPQDTWTGVHEAAEKLRDQLRAQWSRSPGQAVDLVGHSMGGVVVAYYLLTMHDPADPTLPPVGHAVTIASPLEGSDAATGALAAARSIVAHAAIRAGADLLGEPIPHPDDQAPRDLALGSRIVEDIADGWSHANADRWAGPLANGTQVLTLGGSRDVIVPEHRSDLPGAAHVVLPGGHDRVRLTEASRQVVRAFLADDPVPGRAGGLGHVLSYPLGWAEVSLGRTVDAVLP